MAKAKATKSGEKAKKRCQIPGCGRLVPAAEITKRKGEHFAACNACRKPVRSKQEVHDNMVTILVQQSGEISVLQSRVRALVLICGRLTARVGRMEAKAR